VHCKRLLMTQSGHQRYPIQSVSHRKEIIGIYRDSRALLADLVLLDWGVVVARVSELLRVTGFDPEAIEAICEAYVRARKPVGETSKSHAMNEIIALRILSLAKNGERDPDRLCAGALAALPVRSDTDF